MNKKIYYARPIYLYGTPMDESNKVMLETLGFEVYDPNKNELLEEYKKIGMTAYYNVIKEVNAIAFYCPTAEITAGVFKEIEFAKSLNLPVIEIPNMLYKRILTPEETRQHLKNIGHR